MSSVKLKKCTKRYKRSFKRFDDDLTEEVLKYLPFEDKVRLESVSKQFHRCVFERQTQLVIRQSVVSVSNRVNKHRMTTDFDDRHALDLNAFETLLRKCPSIDTICVFGPKFADNEQILDVIMRSLDSNCIQLNGFGMDFETIIDTQRWYQVMAKLGTHLRQLIFSTQTAIDSNALRFCGQLNHISMPLMPSQDITDLIESPDLVQSLKRLSLHITSYAAMNKKIPFIGHGLQAIDLTFDCEDEKLLKTLMTQLLDRCGDLRHISLTFGIKSMVKCETLLNKTLREMSHKCRKLAKIEINFLNRIYNLHTVFKGIGIPSLKCLKINFFTENNCDFVSKTLQKNPNINHLELHFNPQSTKALTDRFFTGIDTHLPRLRVLKISNADISGQAMDLMAKHPKLTVISIALLDSVDTTHCSLYRLVKNCPKLDSLELHNTSDNMITNEELSQLIVYKHQKRKPVFHPSIGITIGIKSLNICDKLL